MKLLFIVLASAVIGSINAAPFQKDGVMWNDLKVTWSLNPFSSYTFAQLPRKRDDAVSKGFELLDEHCSDSTKPFRGYRYWLDEDPAVILIYDKNGYIAGIQTGIDLHKYNYDPGAWRSGHPYVNYLDLQTLTAYFVDPTTICTGRSDSDFNNEGTGTGLWIQNGTNPESQLITIPLDQSSVSSTRWTLGKCFYTMGVHYWYDLSTDMPCDHFFPFFLLYNGGKLNGFGFIFNVNVQTPRYEHPPPSSSSQFMQDVPLCFNDDPSYQKMSSMHVYLTSSPQTNFC